MQSRRTPKPPEPTPPREWRQAAEEIGRQAFEAATEPAPPPQEPAWWELPTTTPEELLAWQRKRQASAQKAVETAARIRRDKEKQRAEEEKQRAKENPPIKNQPKRHFEPYWPPDWVLDMRKEKSMKAAKNANPPNPPPPLDPMEKHFTVYEIAEAWQVPVCTARRIFRNVPGVINASTPRSLTSRPWSFLRIPASLATWVHEQRLADWSLDKRRVRLKTLEPTENTNSTTLVEITKGIHTMPNQRYYPQEAPTSSGPARKWIITGHDRNGKPAFGWSAAGLEPPMKPANTTNPPAPSSAMEKHYSLAEVAEAWGISVRMARLIFRDVPGVSDVCNRHSLTSRAYTILRIPASVTARVHESRSAGFVLGAKRKVKR